MRRCSRALISRMRSLEMLALGDVDAGGNDVVWRAVVARQHGAGPGDEATGAVVASPNSFHSPVAAGRRLSCERSSELAQLLPLEE